MSRRDEWFSLWGFTAPAEAHEDPESQLRVRPIDILNSELSSGARLCMMWIRLLACHEQLENYNAKALAADLSVPASTVSRWLKELRDYGALSEFGNTWLTRSARQYVYFIQQDSLNNGPVKIGCATNPKTRLLQLQTASSNALIILHTIKGNIKLERELHAKFASDRIHGEWFVFSKEISEFIESTK